jgi:hypothetical protein
MRFVVLDLEGLFWFTKKVATDLAAQKLRMEIGDKKTRFDVVQSRQMAESLTVETVAFTLFEVAEIVADEKIVVLSHGKGRLYLSTGGE